MPEEVNGFMRLAQDEVDVNVIGDDKVGVFKTVTAAAYILIHEQDLKQLIGNTELLQELSTTNLLIVKQARASLAEKKAAKLRVQ